MRSLSLKKPFRLTRSGTPNGWCSGILKPLLAFILAIGFAHAFAQSAKFQLKGSVLDHTNYKAISGANITVEGTRRGCSSNAEGNFALTVYTRPVYLRVSYVGYETQRIWLEQGTNVITVLLNPAAQSLPDLEIRALNDPVPWFKDRRYAVLDYEVAGGKVFMVVYLFSMKKAELLCRSFAGDTLAEPEPLPFKPASVFRDCLGNVHVMSGDSVYQVCHEGNRTKLCYVTGLRKFGEILADCVTSTDSMLYFRKESADQLSVEYYQVDRFTHRRDFFAALGDEDKERMKRRNPGDYELLTMRDPPRSPERALTWQWLKKVVYLTDQSSLHRVGDQLCMINPVDQTILLYTLSGTFNAKLKMTLYPPGRLPVVAGSKAEPKPPSGIPPDELRHWTREIYADPVANQLYTSFVHGGTYTLYRIDLNTGILRRTLSTGHAYPQKLQVYDRHLFYMYDLPGEGDNRHLFRQKL